MAENTPTPRTGRKHLLTGDQLAGRAGAAPDAGNRGHRPGIGLRVHGVYFLVVSLSALVLLVAFIALASTMR